MVSYDELEIGQVILVMERDQPKLAPFPGRIFYINSHDSRWGIWCLIPKSLCYNFGSPIKMNQNYLVNELRKTINHDLAPMDGARLKFPTTTELLQYGCRKFSREEVVELFPKTDFT